MIDRRRRRLLALLPAAAGACVAGSLLRARTAHAHANAAMPLVRQPLRIPGTQGLLAERPLANATLHAQRAAFDLLPGAATDVWHYAADVDGRTAANPLLRARTGETITATLRNRLDEATTLHWHGLEVDEANDGSGLHPVAPGDEQQYRFRVRNRAGLYWYHAHPHGRTGLQLHRGLAGLLLIDDDEERALRERLDLPWGVRDVPLLIADKQIGDDNAIAYTLGADDWIGNRVLVNWTPEPYLDVQPALHRFRLANVANARLLRPAFVHRGAPLPMQLIGTDGGLLAQPWPVDDLFLAPAQRADVLVDFSAVPPGERVMLRSLAYDPMENEDESGAFMPDPMAEHPGAAMMGAPLDLLELRVEGERTAPRALPERLSALAPPPDVADWPVRRFLLRMDAEGRWLINDWNLHVSGHAPVFTVQRGTREVWEIRNSMTSMPHPIHLHGFQFRIVSRSISPPDVRGRAVAAHGLGPQDLGCMDTVLVWPGEIVRIALDFSQPYAGTQRYMLHCHNLEHEDMGMMVTFAVDDEASDQ